MKHCQHPSSLSLRVTVCAAFVAAAAASQVPAEEPAGLGGLLVAPTRVVFEGRQRTAEIGLVNRGPARASYRISLQSMRMSEDGRIGLAEGDPDPAETVAQALVRFSPRQVTLEPGEIQTVRLQLRKPADLAAGEYRIHLVLREVPDVVEPPGGDTAPASAMSIELTPVYGICIPLIVRQGETEATVSLSNMRLISASAKDAAPRLAFTIHRHGNRSVYGDLQATALGPDGKARVIGLQKGLAVYVPNATRNVDMPLALALDARAIASTIHLSYVSGDGQLLAATDLATR